MPQWCVCHFFLRNNYSQQHSININILKVNPARRIRSFDANKHKTHKEIFSGLRLCGNNSFGFAINTKSYRQALYIVSNCSFLSFMKKTRNTQLLLYRTEIYCWMLCQRLIYIHWFLDFFFQLLLVILLSFAMIMHRLKKFKMQVKVYWNLSLGKKAVKSEILERVLSWTDWETWMQDV